MKHLPAFLLFVLLGISVNAQDEAKTAAIVAEGKKLYRSEMASWYGTDLFMERFKDQKANIGGYFSYSDKEVTNCLFFSKGDEPKVLATISFDSTYSIQTAKVDSKPRGFSTYEKEIYIIRQKALKTINDDSLFSVYQNTSLNIIPLVEGDEKKVYVLTGPKDHDVVILGNDYLLTYDKDNNLTGKKQLHKNIIPVNYGKEGQEVITMHNHLPETGDFITATDICTLLLYQKFAHWKQHYVMSKNYISIWDCEKSELVTLTMEAWEKIRKDQEERQKN